MSTQQSTSSSKKKHGDQFSADRFETATKREGDTVTRLLDAIFDPMHVIPTEPDTVCDNYAESKTASQTLDYHGSDYLIDPFGSAAFGINHRTHSPTNATLRLDLRKDTGSSKPSELDEFLEGHNTNSFIPRYTTRMKLSPEDSCKTFEWLC